jgi:dihydroneopterin aldolase
MTDYIHIEGLEVDAVIGVFDWEREIEQRLVIDLQLGTDITNAAKTDDIQHTLDYAVISERVMDHVKSASAQLIETLAEQIATLVMREFSVMNVRVRVSKPGAVPAARNVAVEIERGRH